MPPPAATQCATPSAADFARQHADPHYVGGQPLRTDRQRIIHSSTFRRLQHKTQVFVVGRGDHYRTRMTHTLEVTDLARTIACELALNAELAEAAALAHDLGHAPFGHAGERALHECMHEHGGFEHNSHSLRVVEYLEHPYPHFRGLNLTRIVRECLAKHTTRYDQPGQHPLQDGRPPPLEGQIAALADRLAYGLHDLQDGLYEGLFEPAALHAVELWCEAYDGPRAATSGGDWLGHVRPAAERIRRRLIDGVVAEARRRASDSGAGVPAPGQRLPLINLPESLDAPVRELEQFLFAHMYRSQTLVRMDSKAKRIITEVFAAYVNEPRLMPPRFAARVDEQGAQRVAADYIAGMTDRFCQQEHARLFDPQMDV